MKFAIAGLLGHKQRLHKISQNIKMRKSKGKQGKESIRSRGLSPPHFFTLEHAIRPDLSLLRRFNLQTHFIIVIGQDQAPVFRQQLTLIFLMILKSGVRKTFCCFGFQLASPYLALDLCIFLPKHGLVLFEIPQNSAVRLLSPY